MAKRDVTEVIAALRDAMVATTAAPRDAALTTLNDILTEVSGGSTLNYREAFIERLIANSMPVGDIQILFDDSAIDDTFTNDVMFALLVKRVETEVAEIAALRVDVTALQAAQTAQQTEIAALRVDVTALQAGQVAQRTDHNALRLDHNALHADHELTKRQLPKVTTAQVIASLVVGVVMFILLWTTKFANGFWSVTTPNFQMVSKTSSVLVDALLGASVGLLFFGVWDVIRRIRNK